MHTIKSFAMLLIFIFFGTCYGRLMGLPSPGVSSSPTPDYDYDELTPEHMPSITTEGDVVKAIKGDNITLECEVVRLGKFSVIWQKENSILWVLQSDPEEPHIQYVIDDDRFGQLNTSLFIRDVTVKDEGKYSCETSTDNDQKIVHRLIVYVPSSVKPKDGLDFVQGHEGEILSLECQATGKPRPKITWRRLKDDKIIGRGSALTIINVTSADAGLYACVASNNVGNPAEALLTLDIQYSPIVTPPETVVHSGVNYEASLWCIVDASPFPKVDWYKEGAPVNPMRLQKGIGNDNKFSLHFEQVLREDFGFYSCNASNFYGNDSAIIELTGRPLIPKVTSDPQGSYGDNYTLTWEVKSYTPITSYFLFLKNDSTDFKDSWINITVPGSPSTSMYHSQRYVLTDLVPGMRMVTKLKADNEFGESEFSYPFTFRTFDEDNATDLGENISMNANAQKLESPVAGDSETLFTNITMDDVATGKSKGNDANTTSTTLILSIKDEELHNVSSLGVPTLTSWEKRRQMMSIVTAVSLSCFFSLYAMR